MQKKTLMKMTSDHYVELATWTFDPVTDDGVLVEVDLEVNSTQKMLRYINVYVSHAGTFAGGDGTTDLVLSGTFYGNSSKAAATGVLQWGQPHVTAAAADTINYTTDQTAAAMNASATTSGEVFCCGTFDGVVTNDAIFNTAPKMAIACTMAGTVYTGTAATVTITVEGVTW